MSPISYQPADNSMLLDGHPLTDWECILGADGVTIGEAEPRLTRTQIPGRHGVLDQTLRDRQGRAYDDKGRDITVGILMTADETDQRQLKRRLGEYQGMRTTLWWQRMWDGEYRGTLAIGEWTDTFGVGMHYLCSSTTLTLHSDDGAQHGPYERIRLNEGVTQIGVKGNRLARPTLELTPTEGSTRVTVTDGVNTLDYQPATPFTGDRRILIDSGQATSMLGTTPLPPTLDSDYPELTPGNTRITLTGATGWIRYEPLYVI